MLNMTDEQIEQNKHRADAQSILHSLLSSGDPLPAPLMAALYRDSDIPIDADLITRVTVHLQDTKVADFRVEPCDDKGITFARVRYYAENKFNLRVSSVDVLRRGEWIDRLHRWAQQKESEQKIDGPFAPIDDADIWKRAGSSKARVPNIRQGRYS